MRAQISPGGAVVRFVADGTPIPEGWADSPCADIGADLQPGPDEVLDGPAVTVTAEAVKRVWTLRPLTGAEVDAVRAAAVAANNIAAGRAREAYLTAVPGQATTYAAKQAEVTRWVSAGRPAAASAAAYPWAGDRADLRSVTVADVLAEWEAVTAAWALVGRQIEAERERVNDAIDAAATVAAIQAAQQSAAYPAP